MTGAARPPSVTGAGLPLDGPHWVFIGEVYRAAEVQQACLVLQDDFAVDVSFLLTLLSFAKDGHLFGETDVEALDRLVEPWRRDVVRPLRAIRREMKPAAVAGAAVAGLRERIKSAELEAEQIEVAMLAHAIAARGYVSNSGAPVTIAVTAERVVAFYAGRAAAPESRRSDIAAATRAVTDAVVRATAS